MPRPANGAAVHRLSLAAPRCDGDLAGDQASVDVRCLSDHGIQHITVVLRVLHHDRQDERHQCSKDRDAIRDLGAIDLAVLGRAAMDQLVS